MIVLDLEWNSGLYERLKLDEIIQIGAVKVQNGKIVDSYNRYIKPTLHKRYSPGAAALPDLKQMEASTWDFPAAYADFMAWCDGDDLFATWSGNDMVVLLKNKIHWELPGHLPTTFLDLQRAFGTTLGTKDDLSLEWAVDYCRLPAVFDPHNALYDALNAWIVCDHIPMDTLLAFRRPNDLITKNKTKLPNRKSPWLGPFKTYQEALSNRGVRRGTCPDCRQSTRVSQWFPGEKNCYYSKFFCPTCGRGYVLRCELYRRGNRGLWANTSSSRGPALRGRYQSASQRPPVELTLPSRKRRKKKPAAKPAG